MSDLFDEFEFKPLTDGLGFHKKQATVENTLSKLELTTPLPRQTPSEERVKSSAFPTTTVDEILKTLNEKKRPEFSTENHKTKISTAPIAPEFKASCWDMSAFLLDFIFVLATNLLCLIIVLLTTKVDLFANLFNPDSDKMVYWSLLSLAVGTTWIYLVANRLFLGFTPGEWVFDQRLGRPQEIGSSIYSLKVFARSLVVVLSGFVLFPIISLFMGRDLLGRWMGLELVKKV